MMFTQLVTGPAVEPISTAEAKAHLRVTYSDDDDYIDSLIVATRVALEDELHRKFITQTYDLMIDRTAREIRLPFGQLQSVGSVKYTDVDDVESTLSASSYRVVTWEEPGRIVLKDGYSWPSVTLREAGGVVVRFTCGYGNADAVPAPLRHAMKMMIGHLYENRETVVVEQGVTVVEIPQAARALAWPHRLVMA